ncbi:hypothetical protein S40293_09194 [Stachybotrys chartarum IBT 40293]|nr:hypothetical protein S40293_09194 [Stachybotrys chartarum IBT 40293]
MLLLLAAKDDDGCLGWSNHTSKPPAAPTEITQRDEAPFDIVRGAAQDTLFQPAHQVKEAEEPSKAIQRHPSPSKPTQRHPSPSKAHPKPIQSPSSAIQAHPVTRSPLCSH